MDFGQMHGDFRFAGPKNQLPRMAIEAIEAFGASVLTMEFRRGIVCSSM
jgi:hypothetical protein